MKKARVLIHGTQDSTVTVEHGATAGATFGVNLRTEDGQVLTLQQLVAMAAGAVAPPSGISVSAWEILTNIPPNVKALENATGSTGIFSVTGASTGALQELEVGASSAVSLSIVNPGGVAGPPMFIVDPTLNALAGQDWALNALPIGSGADMVSQVAFAANTFPARASTGDLVAKPITDFALTILDDANGPAVRTTIGAGTVTSVAVANATGITWAGSPITTSGTLTPTLSANLQSWSGISPASKADDSTVVHLASAETITGAKTLNANLITGVDDWRLTTNTSAASDTRRIGIVPASAITATRTAYALFCAVNHATTPGLAQLVAGSGSDMVLTTAGGQAVRASVDGTVNLGSGPFKWAEVFAANGTINTSDARLKTEVRPFTDAELAAALDLSDAVGFFQFLSAIDRKGVAAREHCGLTVQGAIKIMLSHGLDPFAYGFICHDRWDEMPEIVEEHFEEYDEHGNGVGDPVMITMRDYKAAGDCYGFRPDQLDRFIAKGIRENQKRIEARLDALEKSK